MIKELFFLKVNQENISGMILRGHNSVVPPRFIALHGGGPAANKERIYPIADGIVDSGINILAIDFSGHGESTGELKKSSLHKRVQEAQAAINFRAAKEPLTLCGFSMSGYLALKMLDLYEIETLILFCPAMYDKQAYDVQFDQGFTDIITKSESWRNTDILSPLQSFKGKLLIIIGQEDEVIPSEVITLLDRYSVNVSKKEIYTVPNCPHQIATWLANHPDELSKVQQKISDYLTHF